MNSRVLLQRWISVLLFVLFSFGTAKADETAPTITAVRLEGTNVVVTAKVPIGLRLVTLEGRERLGSGSWEPRAVAYPELNNAVVTFRLPVSRALDLMRVRGDSEPPLPLSFYSGADSFLGDPGGGPMDSYYFRTFDSAGGVVTAFPTSTPPPEGGTRTVVESDIYAIRGQTLYFFNQFRGLQILDITDPDRPSLRGSLRVPAAGEQMYLLGSDHVILLARDECSGMRVGSHILVVQDTGPAPTVVGELDVTGIIQESRLVGTALYVASQTHRSSADGKTWEAGTALSAFDLSNPNAPVARNTIWFPGSGNVVSATDVLFFVVTQDPNRWANSIVRTVDITSPDGTMAEYETIRPAGLIKDKFKMNYAGGIFTSISETRSDAGRLVTRLETFRLPDPRQTGPQGPIKLGEVELGHGEQLHATRFDGDRVYVVTFFRIDPLFIVSIADPAHPVVAGEVEIPGWSTFIEPLGDRLVSVGIETNRVAVSLFDVANPAKPSLLSRVRLGEQHSWSEANSDEKAFTVLPSAGLILLPYTEFGWNGNDSRVQLIDLERNLLTARGVIEHELQARRATVYQNRILSLSGRQYFSVDASDRDHPIIRAELELAVPIDRVFVRGAHLVEIEAGPAGSGPIIRVATTAHPDQILSSLVLSNLSLAGATVRGDFLYVLQAPVSVWWRPVPFVSDGTTNIQPSNSILLTIISLKDLPRLEVVGKTSHLTDLWTGSQMQPVWPQDDVLVWVTEQQFWPFYSPIMVMDGPASFWGYPFWGNQTKTLYAFRVGDPTDPSFASMLNLEAGQNYSKAFAAPGLVYLSHNTSYYWPYLPQPPGIFPGPIRAATADVVMPWIAPAPIGAWSQRSYLDVVDYADPTHPVARGAVNIPGNLVGLSHGGALVYTAARQWTTNWVSDGNIYLSALAYNGVAAHLVDSLPLEASYYPIVVSGTNVFIGRSGRAVPPSTATSPVLENWTVSLAGKFERLASLALEQPLLMLAEFPGMLAGRQTDGTVLLVSHEDPRALRLLGREKFGTCLGIDLNLADGSATEGLWIPLGIYGVVTVQP